MINGRDGEELGQTQKGGWGDSERIFGNYKKEKREGKGEDGIRERTEI